MKPISSGEQPGTLLSRLRQAPPLADKKQAVKKLADLQKGLKGIAPELFDNAPVVDLLLAVADHSPFLWSLVSQNSASLRDIVLGSPEANAQAMIEELRTLASGGLDQDRVMQQLRHLRARQALLVALADLGGVWSIDEVTCSLSAFADATVSCALDFLLLQAAQAGEILLPSKEKPSEGCGVTVLALGKHGARELNYSSDIDLIVFFDPDSIALAPTVEPGKFYTRLAQKLARLLQERTAHGYVHRVDYRLRPDPASTPPAVSLASAYGYYETVGQNWERAAFIKARAIAGDVALGERFLSDLTPFIWRKYFDFAAIADVHAMKRQIHAVRGHSEIAVAGHDIKLGRGGIREIEFFVQTQQLVFGGRRPRLRGRETLLMLAELHEEGWITREARDELSTAYRFLRGIEHRLQMMADEQTQRLPQNEDDLKRFAKFCGYSTLKAFERALIKQARIVQGHYALLFEAGSDLATEGDLVFTGVDDDPQTLETLRRFGFRDPERVGETVRGWHFGRRPAIRSPRAREVLTELVPGLLKAFGGTADPDAALAALDQAFGRMPAAVELLTILQSHDRLRFLFADLLGTAPRLAETVAQAPHVLDALIDPAFGVPLNEEEVAEAQLRELIGRPLEYEDFLDRLRDAARQLRFVTGAHLLSGVFSPAQAGEAYAAIACAVVRVSFEVVRKAFVEEHGAVPNASIAILGLGRLGTRELTAGSDLDLVVIYDFDPAKRESDGARSLDAVVYYTRLTQRLIAALTVPTRRGRLYEVDLRLRPQGGKGPIASQFEGFLAYQMQEAELWEHMALTRARVIAGDEDFAVQVSQSVETIVTRPRDKNEVFSQIRGMRALIAQEKGDDYPWDLKLAAGGLTDLDFCAQGLILSHVHEHPDLAGVSPIECFALARAHGLLKADDAAILIQAHHILDDLHQWQRLAIEGSFRRAAVPDAIVKRLAAIAGQPTEKALLAYLEEVRGEVRSLTQRLWKTGA